MIGLLDTLRKWRSPTCDVEGCDDDDTEPVLIHGEAEMLCFDHMIEALREVVEIGVGKADNSIANPRECPECGATTYQFERCHACGHCHWR